MSLPLLHSPADIVAQLMIDLGAASDPVAVPQGAWPVFVKGEPSTPDNCLTVYDTSPKDGGRIMVDGSRTQHYGLQVRVRAATENTSTIKATGLRVFFDESVKYRGVTFGARHYLVHCFSTVNVLSVGRETPTSKRFIHTVNLMTSLIRLD